MGLRWVFKHERVINPSDPDLRTIADILFLLGYRLSLELRPKIHWAGPWRLNPVGTWQRFGYTNDGGEVARFVRTEHRDEEV